MDVAKKQLHCRVDGCSGVFGYSAARVKHERKEHPDERAQYEQPKKRKRAPVAPKRIPSEPQPKKEAVVAVVLNFCPFCARALPNAHLIQNGRH